MSEFLDDGLPTLEDAVKNLVATTAFDQLRRRCRGGETYDDHFTYVALERLGQALGAEPQTITDATTKLEDDSELAEVISLVPAVNDGAEIAPFVPWHAEPHDRARPADVWNIRDLNDNIVAIAYGDDEEEPAPHVTPEQRAREIVDAHNNRGNPANG